MNPFVYNRSDKELFPLLAEAFTTKTPPPPTLPLDASSGDSADFKPLFSPSAFGKFNDSCATSVASSCSMDEEHFRDARSWSNESMCSMVSSIGHNSDLDFSTCSNSSRRSSGNSPVPGGSLSRRCAKSASSSGGGSGNSPLSLSLAGLVQSRGNSGGMHAETPMKMPPFSLGVIPEEEGGAPSPPSVLCTPATALASRLDSMSMSFSSAKTPSPEPASPNRRTSSRPQSPEDVDSPFRDAWDKQDVAKCDAFFASLDTHSDHGGSPKSLLVAHCELSGYESSFHVPGSPQFMDSEPMTPPFPDASPAKLSFKTPFTKAAAARRASPPFGTPGGPFTPCPVRGGGQGSGLAGGGATASFLETPVGRPPNVSFRRRQFTPGCVFPTPLSKAPQQDDTGSLTPTFRVPLSSIKKRRRPSGEHAPRFGSGRTPSGEDAARFASGRTPKTPFTNPSAVFRAALSSVKRAKLAVSAAAAASSQRRPLHESVSRIRVPTFDTPHTKKGSLHGGSGQMSDASPVFRVPFSSIKKRPREKCVGESLPSRTPRRPRPLVPPFDNSVTTPLTQSSKGGAAFSHMTTPLTQSSKGGAAFSHMTTPFAQSSKGGAAFSHMTTPLTQSSKVGPAFILPFSSIKKPLGVSSQTSQSQARNRVRAPSPQWQHSDAVSPVPLADSNSVYSSQRGTTSSSTVSFTPDYPSGPFSSSLQVYIKPKTLSFETSFTTSPLPVPSSDENADPNCDMSFGSGGCHGSSPVPGGKHAARATSSSSAAAAGMSATPISFAPPKAKYSSHSGESPFGALASTPMSDASSIGESASEMSIAVRQRIDFGSPLPRS